MDPTVLFVISTSTFIEEKCRENHAKMDAVIKI